MSNPSNTRARISRRIARTGLLCNVWTRRPPWTSPNFIPAVKFARSEAHHPSSTPILGSAVEPSSTEIAEGPAGRQNERKRESRLRDSAARECGSGRMAIGCAPRVSAASRSLSPRRYLTVRTAPSHGSRARPESRTRSRAPTAWSSTTSARRWTVSSKT